MVPAADYARLEVEAKEHDRTISAEVRRAIRQYLNNGERNAA